MRMSRFGGARTGPRCHREDFTRRVIAIGAPAADFWVEIKDWYQIFDHPQEAGHHIPSHHQGEYHPGFSWRLHVQHAQIIGDEVEASEL